MIILSVIALIIGGLNWMSIGLLQYDFIAGVFGTQASIFSRLVYIIIGIGTAYVCFDLLRNKGKILLFGRKKNQESQTPHNFVAQSSKIDHNEYYDAKPLTPRENDNYQNDDKFNPL